MSSRFTRLVPMLVLAAGIVAATPRSGSAQSWLDRAKQRVKDKIQQRTDEATDSATDVALDKTAHVVRCVISNKECIRKAQQSGQQVAITNTQGAPVSTADSANAIVAAGGATASVATGSGGVPSGGAMAPGSDVMVNYDFIPGDRVIFAEDFTRDNIGDFPQTVRVEGRELRSSRFEG